MSKAKTWIQVKEAGLYDRKAARRTASVLVPSDKLAALQSENLALRKLVVDLSSVRMLLISLQNRMTFEEKKIYENFMIKSKEWLEKAGK